MALRPRRRETELAFETLSIEGGLLSPEWLSRVAQLTAGQQSESDYRVPKGLNLRDEIGRYWRIAHAHWQEFVSGLERSTQGRAPKDADRQSLADRFVHALMCESLGFATLVPIGPVVVDGRNYPVGLSALGGRVPVVVAPAGAGLDAPSPVFGDGGRKRSPFGLAQEFLNASDDATWGIVSDGLRLRILRDNSSLTRPAWVEADIGRIFAEDRYADFAAMWLLAHETRFGRPTSEEQEGDDAPFECALDAWRAAGREEGTRARDELREGFKEALLALGQGFLAHPENGDLRTSLQDGSLTKNAYFQQLLRLVYRFIFLLTAEERDLLHPPRTSDDVRLLYASGYGLRRLRDRSAKRSAHDQFSDLWDATTIVFRGLADSELRLGLPALAGLFARAQCPSLDAAKLENRWLLLAVFRLSWLRQTSGLARVNWRDMGPEELGGIYESLLELEPQIAQEGRAFAFATGAETKGNARKKTGSYYTPDSLVQVLLKSALEPVVQSTIAASPVNPVEALLGLSIVDPACGSGHFLLAAARRLAGHVARLQSEGTPSATEYRSALRQVIAHCVHGVDLNPMAVELCKVSLWMEAVEPGLPLTFLDSHVQCGNALFGTTPTLMAEGIPDAAWEPIEGDDKKVAAVLKRRNKQAIAGQRSLSAMLIESKVGETEQVSLAFAALEAATDADPEALARKEFQWEGILESEVYRHQRFVADAWCAAFVWPKKAGHLAEAAPTNDLWRQMRDGVGQVPALTADTITILASRYQFFHWHLAFPQVFARGGFDIVLGNPPWEKINLRDEEFFADLDPAIAEASSKSVRKKLIADLESGNAELFSRYLAAKTVQDGISHYFRASGYFPLTGVSRINLYSVFCELGLRIVSGGGRLGMVLPSGIVTDDNNKTLFGALIKARRIIHAIDFENRRGIFPGVHRSYRFCLFCAGGQEANWSSPAFAFWLSDVSDLADESKLFSLTPEDIVLLSPESGTCPTFHSQVEAKIVKSIYQRIPPLTLHTMKSDWPGKPRTPFNMANDSGLFVMAKEARLRVHDRRTGALLPLYEAKCIHQFNHRYASFEDVGAEVVVETSESELDNPSFGIAGRYYLERAVLEERYHGEWFLVWRDITHAANERTCISAVVPGRPCGHTLSIVEDVSAVNAAVLIACTNSFVCDFAARQRLSGSHLNHGVWKQLPVVSPEQLTQLSSWLLGSATISEWLLPRVIELSYTAVDLQPFARGVGYVGQPFRWNPGRRFLLRAELDAAFFHLYGLSRDDTDYVMDTFPIVRRNDEKAYGEYRTKRVILEIYDAMAEAIRTGHPYSTRLNPPPADPLVAHPPRGTHA